MQVTHYNSFDEYLNSFNAGELKLEHYKDVPAIEVPIEEEDPIRVEVVEKEGKKRGKSVEAD